MINELYLIMSPGGGESIVPKEVFDQMVPAPEPQNVVKFLSESRCHQAEVAAESRGHARSQAAYKEEIDLLRSELAKEKAVGDERVRNVAEMQRIVDSQKAQIDALKDKIQAQAKASAQESLAQEQSQQDQPQAQLQMQAREVWRLDITPWHQPLRSVYFSSKERLDAYCAQVESADSILRGSHSLHMKVHVDFDKIFIQ